MYIRTYVHTYIHTHAQGNKLHRTLSSTPNSLWCSLIIFHSALFFFHFENVCNCSQLDWLQDPWFRPALWNAHSKPLSCAHTGENISFGHSHVHHRRHQLTSKSWSKAVPLTLFGEGYSVTMRSTGRTMWWARLLYFRTKMRWVSACQALLWALFIINMFNHHHGTTMLHTVSLVLHASLRCKLQKVAIKCGSSSENQLSWLQSPQLCLPRAFRSLYSLF
jgi:hypothetical protein